MSAYAREVEVEARVDQFFADLEHIGWEDLGSISFPADTPERTAARTAAAASAAGSGRGPFLARTRHSAREWVLNAYAGGMYQPTWFGLNWGRSTGSLPDRVAVARAVEDAAAAAVVEDLVDSSAVEELRMPFELIAAMHPPPAANRSGTRAGRWSRPVAAGLLILFVGGLLFTAFEFGLLGAAIPLVMFAAIFVGLARQSAE